MFSDPGPYPFLMSTKKFTTNAYWLGHGGPTDKENQVKTNKKYLFLAWASTSILMLANPTSRSVIPVSEKICPTENCHSYVGSVPISTSESIPISDIKII